MAMLPRGPFPSFTSLPLSLLMLYSQGQAFRAKLSPRRKSLCNSAARAAHVATQPSGVVIHVLPRFADQRGTALAVIMSPGPA